MKKIRMIIDVLMTAMLPLLMAYSLIGESNHDILGIVMFALFIAHHIINRNRTAYKSDQCKAERKNK